MNTYIELYTCFSFGSICRFRNFAPIKSNGNTAVCPAIPATPPFIAFSRNLGATYSV